MKIPKNERLWVSYLDFNGTLTQIITSKSDSRDTYYLYEVSGDSIKKLGKSSSPTELENKFNIRKTPEGSHAE